MGSFHLAVVVIIMLTDMKCFLIIVSLLAFEEGGARSPHIPSHNDAPATSTTSKGLFDRLKSELIEWILDMDNGKHGPNKRTECLDSCGVCMSGCQGHLHTYSYTRCIQRCKLGICKKNKVPSDPICH